MTTKDRIAARIQVLHERVMAGECIIMRKDYTDISAQSEINNVVTSLTLYKNQVAGTTNDIFQQPNIKESFTEELDIIEEKIEKLLSVVAAL